MMRSLAARTDSGSPATRTWGSAVKKKVHLSQLGNLVKKRKQNIVFKNVRQCFKFTKREEGKSAGGRVHKKKRKKN